MSAPAAFKATFSDFRLIKGRKVAQLIFELPIEGCDAALEAMGGVPQPHEERWAAIARIDLKAIPTEDDGLPTAEDVRGIIAPSKKPRQWSQLSYAQQAGIRCNDPDFWRFINEYNGLEASDDGIRSSEGAASFVRIRCGVKSRADFDRGASGLNWMKLDESYDAWKRERVF